MKKTIAFVIAVMAAMVVSWPIAHGITLIKNCGWTCFFDAACQPTKE